MSKRRAQQARDVRRAARAKEVHAPAGGVSTLPICILAGGGLVFVLAVASLVRRPDSPPSAPPAPADLALLEPVLRSRFDAHLQAVRQHPQDPESHGRLGILFEAHGYPRLAMDAYAMAMNLDATDVRWRHLYGLRAFDSGLNEAAEAAFRAVRLVKPSYAPALERLALLLMERGGDAEAAALFE